MSEGGELVVLSHLPWSFVWQRPQHLISRLARGRRAWFVEEPAVVAGAERPELSVSTVDGLRRVTYALTGPLRPPGFDDPQAAGHHDEVVSLLGEHPDRTVWIYTPAALPLARALAPRLLVYDVMDDLTAFRFAPPELRALRDQALAEADVVFAGGRSLYEGVRDQAGDRGFLFPSGVEPEHFFAARALRAPRPRPVAGYVGVIDERLDLELVGELARRLPDWDVELVGPLCKLAEEDLPRAANLRYPGMVGYEELPRVMGGFDVALMPFALNEATRSISPTKTLEYLAAGLPVVSTRVPDVVAQYRGVVDLRDDAEGFARACRTTLEHCPDARDATVRPLLHLHHWDTIAARMAALMAQAAAGEPLHDEAQSPPRSRPRATRPDEAVA
jgi:glycosyltransferase involved in cell wall biosynthesis